MNLKQVSDSTVNHVGRFFVKHLSKCNLLVNHDYEKLAIIDCVFNEIKSFEVPYPFLMTHSYFSKKGEYFLWYCDSDNYICFLDLTKNNAVPVKSILPEDVFLYPEYIWDDGKFVIAGHKDIFFCYDIKKQELYIIENRIVEQSYQFFNELLHYDSAYRVLFYDFEKEVVVYRTEEVGRANIVYVKDFIKNININFEAPCEYIHAASYLDGVLVLVEDDNFIFYHLDKEFGRIVNNKNIWLFRSAELFKYKNKMYCVTLSYFFNDMKQNTISIYEIKE